MLSLLRPLYMEVLEDNMKRQDVIDLFRRFDVDDNGEIFKYEVVKVLNEQCRVVRAGGGGAQVEHTSD